MRTIDLSNYEDEAFNEVVNADIREATSPEQYEALRQPEVLQRWHDELQTLKRNLEYQMSTNKAERSAKYVELKRQPNGDELWASWMADNDRWRSGALKFYRGIERCLADAKSRLAELRRSQYALGLVGDREQAIRRIVILESAIERHKNEVLYGEDPETEALDEELWKVLDTRDLVT